MGKGVRGQGSWSPQVDDRLRQVARALLSKGSGGKWDAYRHDPISYFREVLGVEPWENDPRDGWFGPEPGQASQADLVRAVGEHDLVACKSGHKIGKALHHDTPIPTPDGWRRHGDLRVGDRVFDERGHPCNVVNVIPWSSRPLMRVTFEDGSHVDADEHHEWVVHTRASRKQSGRRPQTLETRELFERVHVPNGRDEDGQPRFIANFTVDLPGPLEMPAVDLPLDPYLLGVWLGVGTTRAPSITTPDWEVEEAFNEAGFKTKLYARKGKAWTFAAGTEQPGSPLRTALSAIGVLGNKHVPEVYLWASAEQRLALLQGLMDTDGTVTAKGLVEFNNTNERLARAVAQLARSLGIKARIHERRATLAGRDCGPVWDVSWCSPLPVFRLQRHLDRLRTTWAKKVSCHRRMAIVSVERLPGTNDAQCITVDSPSHLYLCGESMVPTHNSVTAVGLALWFVCTRRNARVLLTAPTFNQVKNILWKELRNLFRNRALADKLGAECPLDPSTGLQLPDGNEIIGISTKTKENLAGYSGAELFFIVDEASGFPDDLWEVLSSGNAAGGAKIFVISNPTRTAGWFYDLFRRKLSGWQLFTVSSEGTPNARSGQKLIPGLALRTFIERMREKCGGSELDSDGVPAYRKDPEYQVRIRGEFPSQGAAAVVPAALLERAVAKWKPEPAFFPDDDVCVGVDVARYGDDKSVVWPVRGNHAFKPSSVNGADGNQVAAEVIRRCYEVRAPGGRVRVNVDGIGVGASVVDALKTSKEVLAGWIVVVDLNVGERADVERKIVDGKEVEVEHYKNLRSQLWFGVSRWLWKGGTLPDHDEATQELLCATYSFDLKNRKKVLAKDVMREILERSPDFADALCMAVYDGKRGRWFEFSYDSVATTGAATVDRVRGSKRRAIALYDDEDDDGGGSGRGGMF